MNPKIEFYIDGNLVAMRDLSTYPSSKGESVQVVLPNKLPAGQHNISIKLYTPRAIYQSEISIEYELPAPTEQREGEVLPPPEIPNPFQAVSNLFGSIFGNR